MGVGVRSWGRVAPGITPWSDPAHPLAEVAIRIDREAAKDISRVWCPLYKGIEHLALETEKPRRMRGQSPRIDLKTPGLSFLVNPSNGDRLLECDSISTSDFLGKHLLQAAITHQSLVSPVSVSVPQVGLCRLTIVSSFHEKLYNRGSAHTTLLALGAPPRH